MRFLALAALALSACTAEIASDLDEPRSREVMAALGRAGIAAEREAAGGRGADTAFAVAVPSGDAARAMAVLEAEGLPREPRAGLSALYASASMIPTATEEKARYIDALSAEIAGHVARLDGVLDASVIITAPTPDPLAPPDAPRPTATASVLVRTRAGAATIDEAAIRTLVAGAAEGLTPDAVTVVQTRAPAPPETTAAFAKVGPIHVAHGSKLALQATLGLALLLILALAAWTFRTERRRADLARRVAILERDR